MKTIIISILTFSFLFAGPFLNAGGGNGGSGKSPSSGSVKRLIRAFSDMDLDGNARLSFREFAANIRGLPEAGERVFRRVDRNRNRSISIREFADYRDVMLPPGARVPVDGVKMEFRRLDGDGDGIISVAEIAVAMTFADGAALDHYFAGLDSDASGGVSLDEWREATAPPPSPDGEAFTRYLGLALEAATALATSEGRASRVVRIDGEWQIVTADYSPQRLNFSLIEGKVSKVTTG